MRIAVIGTEGAGKTTFLTMLSEYCRTEAPTHLHMRPATAETTLYVAKQSEKLRQGAWPAQTIPDTMQNLVWTISVPGSDKTSELKICDVSGQNVRGFILGDGHIKDAPGHEQMRDYVMKADAIVFLFDFTEFEKSSHEEVKLAEFRFILEAMLYGTGILEDKQRLLIATKADLLPEGERTDVPALLHKYLGGNGSSPFKTTCCAVGVETTPQIKDGTARRIPVHPLKSLGMSEVAEQIYKSFLNHQEDEKEGEILDLILKTMLGVTCALIIAVTGIIGLVAVVAIGIYLLRFRPLVGQQLILRLKKWIKCVVRKTRK